MKTTKKSIWSIIVSVCLFTVLVCATLSINSEGKNSSSPSLPAKHMDLSKEEQIFLQKLEQSRQKARKPRTSHGPVKDGLAAFLICEGKQFNIGEPIPVMLGIVYGGPEKHMTVQPPLPTCMPDYVSWFSITGPDGNDVPYTGPSVHFVPDRETRRAIRLKPLRFCGMVKNDVGDHYELDKPGSYTIKWHYNIPNIRTFPTSEVAWWQGHLVSNEIQIEIVKPIHDLKPGKSLTNSVGMKLVYIPPGEFRMGSRDSAAEVARKGTSKSEYYIHEHPQHRVRVTKGFFMGTTEVTQAQYIEVMGKNQSMFKGEDNPVETVSWNDAVEFCNRLSEKEGRTYRLPTEAEWEYACRAGTTTPFYTGETINTSQANFDGDHIYGSGAKGIDRSRTTSVGSFQPNGLGLYDMHGNVLEWCIDWYAEDYYEVSPSADPQGPPTGISRVLRGGSFNHSALHCRSARRDGIDPRFHFFSLGFRVLLEK